MAFATNPASAVLGGFTHALTNKFFEFIKAEHPWAEQFEMPYEVFIGPSGETRFARILKTVAYVCVDESADGSPILQRWPIKKLTHYVHR
jgi:hypothetical protein